MVHGSWGHRVGMVIISCPPPSEPHSSLDTRVGPPQLSDWSFCPFTLSASFFQAALCDSPFFAINCDVLLEASIVSDENSHFGLSGVWQAELFALEIYCQRDRWAPVQTMAGLPPFPTQFGPWVPTAHLALRAGPAYSHPLTGTWLTSRSQEPSWWGRLAGICAVSSLGVCPPFNSRYFNWTPTLCQAR
jgi:hypothetical protein